MKKIYTIVLLVFLLVGCSDNKGNEASNNKKMTLTDIEMYADGAECAAGTEMRIGVKPVPQNANIDSIKIESDDNDVLKLESGNTTLDKVLCLKPGEVHITATANGNITHTGTITVYQGAESIKFNKSSISLYVGDEQQITATVLPEDSKYKDLTWESSDEDVATVSQSGKIKAVKVGTATITATTEEGISNKVSVTVSTKPIKYSGKGTKVVKKVKIPEGNYMMKLSNSGNSNFAVWLYDDSGSKDLLVNEIGKYSGSVIIRDGYSDTTEDGMIEVKSNGK